MEVCISSNVLTGCCASLEQHPVRKLFDAGVLVTLNTDDPEMFRTTLAREYQIAQESLGFSDEELRERRIRFARRSCRRAEASTSAVLNQTTADHTLREPHVDLSDFTVVRESRAKLPLTHQCDNTMPKHIGIVACSAEGAALCYRTICDEAPALMGRHRIPRSACTPTVWANTWSTSIADDWEGVAELMLSSAEQTA